MNELVLALLTIIPILEDDPNGNPKEGAVGPYHIRAGFLKDVNETIIGLKPKDFYTLEDCKNERKAKHIVSSYLNYWGKRYKAIKGEEPTISVLARIHNGGPGGWYKASTKDYGQRATNLYEEGVHKR